MTFTLNDDEWGLLRGLPESTLVDLAVELSILVPESIDTRELLEKCVPLIVERARSEGLPFSKYDREDLEELPAADLASIAQLQGLAAGATAAKVLSAGDKVYRMYQSKYPDSAVAMCLPMLLTAVARAARTPPGA